MLMSPIISSLSWVLKGRNGAAATLQTLLARLCILVINIATGIITARALGPEGRGEQAAMILWSGFLAGVMTLGIPSALIYNFRHYPKEKSEFFAAALLVGTVMGVFASLVGIVFTPRWLSQYSAETTYVAQWLMLTAPLTLLQLVVAAALEANGEFATSNLLRCLLPLTTLIALVVLALASALTPFTAALAYALTGLPVFFWVLTRLWRLLHPQWWGIGTACKRLINYGLRSYGIDLVSTLSWYVDQVLVIGLLTPASMGLYVIALSLSRMLYVFQISVVTVLFPKTAALPTTEVVALTGRAVRVSTAFTLLASVAVLILGPVLLRLFYGSEYMGATAVLRILVIQVVLSGATMVLAQAFMALGRPGTVTILQGIGLGLSVPLMLWLIPIYGLVGAGLALLISSVVRLLLVLVGYPTLLEVLPPALLISREDLYFLKQKFFARSE